MNTKLKTCGICEKEFPRLWKAKTREHPAMCQACWSAYKAPGSDDHSKLVSKVAQKKKRSYIAPISEKKAKELVEYRKLRDEYMKAHRVCEVKSEVCTGKSEDLHHRKPRAYHLTDVSVFLATCRQCHEKIERDDSWARKKGFKLNHL